MRIKLVIEYDGGAYAGFQVQPPGTSPTVQGTLEEAICRLTGASVRVHASGRTDAGVHAWGQVVHFDMESALPVKRLAEALSGVLPADVTIIEAVQVSESFHARKSAVRKEYEYLIYNTPRRSPLWRAHAAWVRPPLNLGRMQEAAAQFAGRHDFSAFTSSHRSAQLTARTVFRSEVAEVPTRTCQREGSALFAFRVEADGFLMHMVRVMAGTLIDVGRGRLPPGTVRAALESGRRSDAGPTAPPHGLYLKHVWY